MNGGNILTLQKILGHSDIEMAMRYSHLSPDFLEEATRLNPLSNIKSTRYVMSLFKYYTPESFDFICVDGGVSARFSQPSVLNDVFELDGKIEENFEVEQSFILESMEEKYPHIKKWIKMTSNLLYKKSKS